jgi:VanZ family protein
VSSYRAGAFLNVAPAVLYVGVVFYLGSISIDPMQGVDFELKDKVAHFIAFGSMQLTQARAMSFIWPEWSRKRVATWAAICTTLVGALLEVWQSALPHRSADPWDLLADMIGATAAAFLWVWFLGERAEAT